MIAVDSVALGSIRRSVRQRRLQRLVLQAAVQRVRDDVREGVPREASYVRFMTAIGVDVRTKK